MSKARIINSPDFGPVSVMELRVFRDLERYLDEKKRKERRAKQKGHDACLIEKKEKEGKQRGQR